MEGMVTEGRWKAIVAVAVLTITAVAGIVRVVANCMCFDTTVTLSISVVVLDVARTGFCRTTPCAGGNLFLFERLKTAVAFGLRNVRVLDALLSRMSFLVADRAFVATSVLRAVVRVAVTVVCAIGLCVQPCSVFLG